MERSVKVSSRGDWSSYIGDDGIRSDATDRSLNILLNKSAVSS